MFFFKGYRLIKWRFLQGKQEIDLIFRSGNKIVICEVKTRMGIEYNMNNLEKIVSHEQIKRIVSLGNNFILKNPRYSRMEYRFDLCIVSSFLKFPLHIKNIGW